MSSEPDTRRTHAYTIRRMSNFAERESYKCVELSTPVVDFSSLACFKRTIINVDFTQFLKC